MAGILIEYGGTSEELVWKTDVPSNGKNSKVVVRPSQEAIYMLNGSASNTLRSGSHPLPMPKASGLERLGTLFGKKPDCVGEIYYFNLAVVRAIEWGTRKKVEIIDPIYRIPIRVGAGGTMHLKVSDSRKLLEKLVGMQEDFTRQQLDEFFKGILNAYVKAALANTLAQSSNSCLELAREQARLAANLQEKLSEEFENYGVTLERFFVERIEVEEEDKAKIREVISRTGVESTEKKIILQNQSETIDLEQMLEEKKAIHEDHLARMKAYTKAYQTVSEGHAENAVRAEAGRIEASIEKERWGVERERMALETAQEMAKQQSAGGNLYVTGVQAGTMTESARAGEAAAAAVTDIVGMVLKNSSSGGSGSSDRAASYEKEREFLRMEFETGILSKEELKEELLKLKKKYESE